MKTVKQLLADKGRPICSVSPDDSIYDALRRMADQDIGAVLVLERDALVGIFSERDYARKVALFGKTSKDMKVREVMTEKVFYVTPSCTVEEGMALMTNKKVRHLPVEIAVGKAVMDAILTPEHHGVAVAVVAQEILGEVERRIGKESRAGHPVGQSRRTLRRENRTDALLQFHRDWSAGIRRARAGAAAS